MDKYDQHIAELNALEGEAQLRQISIDWLNGKGLFQSHYELLQSGIAKSTRSWGRL